jgi:hypothetical protein
MFPIGHQPGVHIPGTLVPIGAVVAQQQQAEIDRRRRRNLLLLLNG